MAMGQTNHRRIQRNKPKTPDMHKGRVNAPTLQLAELTATMRANSGNTAIRITDANHAETRSVQKRKKRPGGVSRHAASS